MKRLFGLALALVVSVVTVRAQMLPPLPSPSAQCHWNVNGDTQHTHNDNSSVGDVAGPFQVNFVHTLFHTSAYIGQYYVGNQKTSDAQNTLVWDSTNSGIQPPEKGNPGGVVAWGGHFVVTPSLPHGWAKSMSSIYTYFPEGSTTVTSMIAPYHSIVDVSKPEPPVSGQEQIISSECRVSSPKSGNNTYGNQTISLETPWPKAAISAPWQFSYGTYNYANSFVNEQPSVSDVIVDPDFHNGVPGRIIDSVTMTGDMVHRLVTLDPQMLGNGRHRIMLRRTQPNNGDTLAALLVFYVDMASSGPPVCTPPDVLVNGQCVTPPTVPVISFIPRPITGQEETINGVPDGKLFVCVNGTCKPF